MKSINLIIVILVIFFKTGNVLSNENIFNVNNIEIAKNPNKYKQLKKKLKQNLKTSLLFDTKSYCYHLEEAYVRAINSMKSIKKID